jgi:hypothetical protein
MRRLVNSRRDRPSPQHEHVLGLCDRHRPSGRAHAVPRNLRPGCVTGAARERVAACFDKRCARGVHGIDRSVGHAVGVARLQRLDRTRRSPTRPHQCERRRPPRALGFVGPRTRHSHTARQRDEVEACLRYVAALGPAFAINNGQRRIGVLAVDVADPDVCFTVRVGERADVHAGVEAGADLTLTGDAVELLEALSVRAPLRQRIPNNSSWLLAGLLEIFESDRA